MIVVLTFIVVALCVVTYLLRESLFAEIKQRQELQANVRKLLQDIADQVDASTAMIESSNTAMTDSLSILDTKIHALAKTQGLVLVNGLWQYETVISKPSTQKAKTVTKKTPVKGGVK